MACGTSIVAGQQERLGAGDRTQPSHRRLRTGTWAIRQTEHPNGDAVHADDHGRAPEGLQPIDRGLRRAVGRSAASGPVVSIRKVVGPAYFDHPTAHTGTHAPPRHRLEVLDRLRRDTALPRCGDHGAGQRMLRGVLGSGSEPQQFRFSHTAIRQDADLDHLRRARGERAGLVEATRSTVPRCSSTTADFTSTPWRPALAITDSSGGMVAGTTAHGDAAIMKVTVLPSRFSAFAVAVGPTSLATSAWISAWRCRVAASGRADAGVRPAGAGSGRATAACSSSSRRHLRCARTTLSTAVVRLWSRVPPVRDLNRLRRTTTGAVSIRTAAIAAHDANAWMLGQPGGKGVGGPVRQQVDRPVGTHVDHHGAVDMSAADGPIVDTGLHQLTDRRQPDRAHEPQQR